MTRGMILLARLLLAAVAAPNAGSAVAAAPFSNGNAAPGTKILEGAKEQKDTSDDSGWTKADKKEFQHNILHGLSQLADQYGSAMGVADVNVSDTTLVPSTFHQKAMMMCGADCAQDKALSRMGTQVAKFMTLVQRHLQALGLAVKTDVIHGQAVDKMMEKDKKGVLIYGKVQKALDAAQFWGKFSNILLDAFDLEWKKIEKRQKQFDKADRGIAYRRKVWTKEVEDYNILSLKTLFKAKEVSKDQETTYPLENEYITEQFEGKNKQLDKLVKSIGNRLKVMFIKLDRKSQRDDEGLQLEWDNFNQMLADFVQEMQPAVESMFNSLGKEFKDMKSRAMKKAQEALGDTNRGNRAIQWAVGEQRASAQALTSTKNYGQDIVDTVKELLATDRRAKDLGEYQDQINMKLKENVADARGKVMEIAQKFDSQESNADMQQETAYNELVQGGDAMAIGFAQESVTARNEMLEFATAAVKKAKHEIAHGDLLSKTADQNAEKVVVNADAVGKAVVEQIERTILEWSNDEDDSGWKDIVKGDITSSAAEGQNYLDAVKTRSQDNSKEILNGLNETITQTDMWFKDQQDAMDSLGENLKERVKDKFTEHNKKQVNIASDIIEISKALSAIEKEARNKMKEVSGIIYSLGANAELITGVDKGPFKAKVSDMEEKLKEESKSMKKMTADKQADLESNLKKYVTAYDTNSQQYIAQADTALAKAKGQNEQRAFKARTQNKDMLELYEEADGTTSQEQKMKQYMVDTFNEVHALQGSVQSSLIAQQKHAADGAHKDLMATTGAMAKTLDQRTDEMLPPEKEKLESEEKDIVSLGGTVAQGLTVQQGEQKTLDSNVLKFASAVAKYGPYTKKALSNLMGDVHGLHEEVVGYTPQLSDMAGAGMDSIWASVQAALEAYKVRTGTMNAAEVAAFYDKLKAMRPDDPNFDLAHQAMEKATGAVATVQSMRKEFEKQAAIQENIAAGGLQMAEQHAWKASNGGEAGMKDISGMLDGMSDELNAKAIAANAMADHVGRTLMGDVDAAEKKAAASAAGVGNDLEHDESEATSMMNKAQGGITADATLASLATPDMGAALQALLGVTSGADRNFMVLQHGEEKQKALRLRWLATVIDFVQQLADSMDPDFAPPTSHEAAETDALNGAFTAAQHAVASGGELINSVGSGGDPTLVKFAVKDADRLQREISKAEAAQNTEVHGLVLDGVKEQENQHAKSVQRISGLVGRLSKIVGEMPKLTKVAAALQDSTGDANHYIDYLYDHAGDKANAANGMENAMERDLKGAMLAEGALLADHPDGAGPGSMPSVHGVNVGSLNAHAAAGLGAERAALMGNMQTSMTAFNEAIGDEMGDEGDARQYVNDQEGAAFNEVNGDMSEIRSAADTALGNSQGEAMTAGHELVDLESRADVLNAGVGRLQDAAMAFHIASPMDIKSKDDLNAAAENLQKMDPTVEIPTPPAVMAELAPTEQLRYEADHTRQDLQGIQTLESLVHGVETELRAL